MWLFHGTNEDALAGIFERVLQPPKPDARDHDWTWELSGRAQASAVFLSTSPVASKGGDPVAFALGWPERRFKRRQPGYIVVFDLPPSALHHVRAVVPNTELDGFIAVTAERRRLCQPCAVEAGTEADDGWHLRARWTLTHWCLCYWLVRYCADRHIALTPEGLATALRLEVASAEVGADMTPQRWQAFVDDYLRFIGNHYFAIASEAERERRRRALVRKHGISLPEAFHEDVHARTCPPCLRGQFGWSYTFDGLSDYAPFKAFSGRCRRGAATCAHRRRCRCGHMWR